MQLLEEYVKAVEGASQSTAAPTQVVKKRGRPPKNRQTTSASLPEAQPLPRERMTPRQEAK